MEMLRIGALCIWFIFGSIYDPIKNRAEKRQPELCIFGLNSCRFAPVERFELHVFAAFSFSLSLFVRLLIFHMYYVRQLRVQSAHTARCAKCARKAARETVCRGT